MSVSVEEMQQAVASVEMGAAHLASLEAAHKLQLSQVREVEESLINMTIRAPFDGLVGQVLEDATAEQARADAGAFGPRGAGPRIAHAADRPA